ncbi:MAG: zf-HC2 domain-containing protein [Planctomycetes bacterium]|nr:zf-HC2 domain-containing protein [Planctomycetota bacterium]
MRCREFERNLSEFLDGRLEAGHEERMAAHAGDCASCRAALDRGRRAEACLDALPRPDAPGGLAARVVERALSEGAGAPARPAAPRSGGLSRGEILFRAAVLVLLATLNAATVISLLRPVPETPSPQLAPAIGRQEGPARETVHLQSPDAPGLMPEPRNEVEPIMVALDRCGDFFKTVEILSARPQESRPVLARHIEVAGIDEGIRRARARAEEVRELRESPELVNYLDESARMVEDLRRWSREGHGEEGDKRLVELRERIRAGRLAGKGRELRDELLAAPVFQMELPAPEPGAPEEDVLFVTGARYYYAGQFEPAKRVFLRLSDLPGESPVSDGARFLLARCLVETGEGERAFQIVRRLHEKKIIGKDEVAELVVSFGGGLEPHDGPSGPRMWGHGDFSEGEEENLDFVKVVIWGREVDRDRGPGVRLAIQALARDRGWREHRTETRVEGDRRRTLETLRFAEDEPELAVEYVSNEWR